MISSLYVVIWDGLKDSDGTSGTSQHTGELYLLLPKEAVSCLVGGSRL